MNPRQFIQFFKTRTGAMLLFLLLLMIGFLLVHGFKPRRTASPVISKKGTQSPQIVETVTRAMSLFHPSENEATATSSRSINSAQTVAPPPKGLPPIALFTDTPKSEPTPEPLSDAFAPYGRLVTCELVITVDSSTIDTPIIGLVTADVWHHGRLIIPAGTEVHGTAKLDRVRDRIASNGSWTLVWQNGEELRVQGIALDRETAQPDTSKRSSNKSAEGTQKTANGSWGIEDGSAGLRGEVLKSDDMAEIKLFTATFLSGVASSLTQTQQTIFGTQPTNTWSNAPVMGAQQILDTYAQQILNTIERDGFYVRVPAGKPFYLYITQTIDESKAMIGATRLPDAFAKENASSDKTSLPKQTALPMPSPIPNAMTALPFIPRINPYQPILH